MDAIEALDWGVYSHFAQKAREQPDVVRFMETAYYLSDYLAVGILFSLAALLFTLQRKHRSAQMTAASLALALLIIFGVRFVVPRMRPPAAQAWVGANDMLGSYPSAALFLFMLAMIMLAFAVWGLSRHWWQRLLCIVLAAALTVLAFFSQIYLSLGFLTDLLGGMAGATVVAMIAHQFMDRSNAAAPTGP